MRYIDNKDDVAKYLGSVVGVRDMPYAVVLLRIYSNGFLTSAGFYDELLVPDEPVEPTDSEDCILYHAVGAMYLPKDMHSRKCIFANEMDILLDADQYLMAAAFTKEDVSAVVSSLSTVDLHKAEKIVEQDMPEVNSPEVREEFTVFTDIQGRRYSWCLMLPE